MEKQEYSGSIWKPYSHIIPNMCSTHQCYGLNIDLKIHNAYLGKLPTQFSISHSTLTQLLCRRAGVVSSPANILHWDRRQGLKCVLVQDEVKVQMRPEASQPIFACPGPMGFALCCSQLRGSTHACHPSPGHRLVTGSALSGLQADSFPHTWSHVLPTLLRAQSWAAHSNSICAFEPRPVITATDSSSPPGGVLWSISRFQRCAIHARYANLAGPCHFEAGFSQEHSEAAPGAAEFQSTYLHCWNRLI